MPIWVSQRLFPGHPPEETIAWLGGAGFEGFVWEPVNAAGRLSLPNDSSITASKAALSRETLTHGWLKWPEPLSLDEDPAESLEVMMEVAKGLDCANVILSPATQTLSLPSDRDALREKLDVIFETLTAADLELFLDTDPFPALGTQSFRHSLAAPRNPLGEASAADAVQVYSPIVASSGHVGLIWDFPKRRLIHPEGQIRPAAGHDNVQLIARVGSLDRSRARGLLSERHFFERLPGHGGDRNYIEDIDALRALTSFEPFPVILDRHDRGEFISIEHTQRTLLLSKRALSLCLLG